MAKDTKQHRYIEAIGRRKTAIARVRITPHVAISYVVNDRSFENYFPVREHRESIENALKTAGEKYTFAVSAHIRGGGQTAQAQALRHGIARALVAHEESLRKPLKVKGYLKRDARAKERKKFGLRKARRAPQWSKR